MLPVIFTFALFAHTVLSVPALTIGNGVIVTVRLSVTGEHPPVAVNVMIILPAVISAALGV